MRKEFIIIISCTVIICVFFSILAIFVSLPNGPYQTFPPIKLVEQIDSNTTKIIFGTISPDLKWDDSRILLENINDLTIVDADIKYSNNKLLFNNRADSTINVTFSGKDLSQDGIISDNDYIIITFAKMPLGKEFNFEILYVPSGNIVTNKYFTK